MEALNVANHISEFKKVLSYSKRMGFFFGAGTSCAFGLPNIIGLTDQVKAGLPDDSKVVFEKVIETLSEMKDDEPVTIEDILNHARQISEITRGNEDLNFCEITGAQAKKLDVDICNIIFKVINEKENDADLTDIRRFVSWYDSSCKSYVKEIYTTNYDMLLEMALESCFIPYFDGFTGSYEPFFNSECIDTFPKISDTTGAWIRLWKLHGSLNWSLKPATENTSERIVRTGKIGEPNNELMIYPSKEKYNLSRREPYVAYFDRLKKYLSQGELLFVCSGYSFSDEHVNEILLNALHQNNRLFMIVFCHSDGQVEKMADMVSPYLNICVMGPTQVISNGTLHAWKLIDAEEDDESLEGYWDKETAEFLLGDFKSLVSFLTNNSGSAFSFGVISNGK